VYGPFAGAWTVGTINEMKETRKIIPYDGEGICNTIYIDDVAHSIIKAMQADEQYNGISYLVSGPEAISWKKFYSAHQMPGMQEPVYWNRQDSDKWYAKLVNGSLPSVRHSLKKDPISFLKKTPVYSLYQHFLKSDTFRKKLLHSKERIPKPLNYPSRETFEHLTCKSQVDISKIRRDLKFVPQFEFREGMEKTLLWIDWANLNCNS
jgi:nucleoside-diphosphate-sugar epimerase